MLREGPMPRATVWPCHMLGRRVLRAAAKKASKKSAAKEKRSAEAAATRKTLVRITVKMTPLDHLKSAVSITVITLNLAIWVLLLVVLGSAKFLLPPFRGGIDSLLALVYRTAVRINDLWLRGVMGISWDRPEAGVAKDEVCIVLSNHASWSDILILQSVISLDGPLLKFLSKRELVFIPIFGVIFWAFDFPALRRGAKGTVDEATRRRMDAEALDAACDAVREHPAAMMVFAEGTRFSEEKRESMSSPYRTLLPPRVGGLASIREALAEDADILLDVTLAYPEEASFWLFLSGRLKTVGVVIDRIPLETVPSSREGLIPWLSDRWQRKAARIEVVRSGTR